MTQEVSSARCNQPMVSEDLGRKLIVADSLIRRTYLSGLDEQKVIKFENTGMEPINRDNVRMHQLTRLVYDKRENTLENLLNIYAAVGSAGYGLVLILKSDGKTTILHLGVRSDTAKTKSATSGMKILSQALDGHMCGSKHENLSYDRIVPTGNGDAGESCLLNFDDITQSDTWAVSALAGIPALKTAERDAFTQGLERFIDAMQGIRYTAVVIAEPVLPKRCKVIEEGLERLASTFSGLAKMQVARGSTDTISISKTVTDGITKTIIDSVAKTQSHTMGTNWSRTVGITASAKFGVVGSISGSSSDSKGGSASVTEGATIGYQTAISSLNSSAIGGILACGTSESRTIEVQNKSIARLLEKIDQQLRRMDEAKSYGLWNAGTYFLCENSEDASSAASLFSGCIRGEESYVENTAINVWKKPIDKKRNEKDEKRSLVLEYLKNLRHPRLKLPDSGIPVSPSSLITGNELAMLMHLPRRSVSGVTVIESAGYGRGVHRLEIETKSGADAKQRQIPLGKIRHLFRDQKTDVCLDLDNLVYHTLVTGTTGVGKTTGVKALLANCSKHNVPFLVVEPAKDEYRELCGLAVNQQPVVRLQAGRQGVDCLRLNPLVFPEGHAVSLIEHIDRVCALFNAAFPMYAAMPQLLEEAIVQAYEQKGWDTITSKCRGGKRVFPTLSDVAELVPSIVGKAGYEHEARSTYVGALTTRLRSLMRGALGFTFMAWEEEETPPDILFDSPCVVNVSGVGSPEKRAVLMGLLMIRLQEHRTIQGQQGIDRLKHLVVLEEAHNILKRTASHTNMEIANPQGQAVEYFANALAEMRAFGQGIVIVDQSASALDDSVLKNTNTKIVFRAPFEIDREILGGALALDEKQKKALSTLENHTALVKQNDWLEAVCCHMDKVTTLAEYPQVEKAEDAALDENRSCLTAVILSMIGGRYTGRDTLTVKPEYRRPTHEEISKWLSDNVRDLNLRRKICDMLKYDEFPYRELSKIKDLLQGVHPLAEIMRTAALAASDIGLINYMLISLESKTLFDNQEACMNVIHDCLRCVDSSKMMDNAAKYLENNVTLAREGGCHV